MSLKRGLAWTAAGQGSLFVIQFAGSVIVARLLSPYELGVYALAMAIVGLLGLVQSIGLGSYLVREIDLTPQRVRTAFTVNAAISLLLAAAIGSIGLAGRLVVGDAGVRHMLLVLALTPITAIFSVVPLALLEREADFRLISVANLTRSLIATGATVALALQGWSYYAIAWGQLGGTAVQTLLLCGAARRHLVWRLSLAGWREIASFGAQMVAITGVNSLAGRASDLVLGRLTGLAALGLFNRATNITNLFWENLHLVMGRVAFAELSRRTRQGRPLRDFYLRATAMITACLWPVFTGLAVLAAPLIHLVYGPKWTPAASPFALLALAAVIQLSITLTWEVFVACGETARQARFEVIRTGVGLALFVAGCTISLRAAAMARVADAIFSVLLYRPHLERMTGTSLADTGPIYLRSGLLTALAVSPAAIMTVHVAPGEPTLGDMIDAVVAGCLLWTGGTILLQHPLYLETAALVRRRLAVLAR